MPFETGPFVQVAGFCERAIEDKNDGVLTLVRMIDRVTVTRSKELASIPFVFEATLVLCLKSGYYRGTHAITVSREQPNGTTDDLPIRLPVLFEGEGDRGVNVVGKSAMQFDQDGVYWFDVKLDDERLTRIPFRVIHAIV